VGWGVWGWGVSGRGVCWAGVCVGCAGWGVWGGVCRAGVCVGCAGWGVWGGVCGVVCVGWGGGGRGRRTGHARPCHALPCQVCLCPCVLDPQCVASVSVCGNPGSPFVLFSSQPPTPNPHPHPLTNFPVTVRSRCLLEKWFPPTWRRAASSRQQRPHRRLLPVQPASPKRPPCGDDGPLSLAWVCAPPPPRTHTHTLPSPHPPTHSNHHPSL
jgi:hypothetical protein